MHKIPAHIVGSGHPERARSLASEDVVSSPGVPDTLTAKEWQDRALRLQAEMENYRKRQQRLAQEQVRSEQAHLLVDILALADNLERTLDAAEKDSPLRDGVALTHSELLRVLQKYGVERINTEGETFDPAWHEAVGVVSEAQAGYRRDGRLLRPARVIVAK